MAKNNVVNKLVATRQGQGWRLDAADKTKGDWYLTFTCVGLGG